MRMCIYCGRPIWPEQETTDELAHEWCSNGRQPDPFDNPLDEKDDE